MKPTILSLVMFLLQISLCSNGNAQQPSQEIQDLTKALSGEWSLNVQFGPGASMPKGASAIGTETWRAGPGGFTLLEEEHLQFGKQDVFLMGVIWWDAQTKTFHGMECQNVLPYVCDVKGSLNDITMNWDGKEFTIDEKEVHNGKKSMWHEAWSDISSTSFTQTGDSTPEGGPQKRLFTIRATKNVASAKGTE
jgi:hypothetical protein